jgi:hypothetical protein
VRRQGQKITLPFLSTFQFILRIWDPIGSNTPEGGGKNGQDILQVNLYLSYVILCFITFFPSSFLSTSPRPISEFDNRELSITQLQKDKQYRLGIQLQGKYHERRHGDRMGGFRNGYKFSANDEGNSGLAQFWKYSSGCYANQH